MRLERRKLERMHLNGRQSMGAADWLLWSVWLLFLHSCSTMTLRVTMATRARHVLLSLATLLGVLGLGCQSAPSPGSLGPASDGVARRRRL